MIYINSVLGGPELEGSAIDCAIRRVTDLSRVGEEGDFGSLDIVFHVPGSLFKSDYRGMRAGKFSRKERMLMVQISVPVEVVTSDDAERFVVDALREAVRFARPRFEKALIQYPEEQYLGVVDRIAASLVH